jgi:uncharacterized membrane protein
MARRPKSRIARILLARRRLIVSIAAGLLVIAFLPGHYRTATRLLLGWDVTAALYVGVAFWMVSRSTIETCHARAALYDESDWVIMTIVVASSAASFAAIFAELAAIKSADAPPVISLVVTGATVVLSWTFTHVVFTLHYANLYYRHTDLDTDDKPGAHGGLEFPGTRAPDYRDFLYYSFVIGCACQTADVNTVSPAMRRATLIHGVVAFAFNTAILALMINIGASLV